MEGGLEKKDRGERPRKKGVAARIAKTLGAAGIASFLSTGEVPSVETSQVTQHSVAELKKSRLDSDVRYRERFIAAQIEKARKKLQSPLVKEALNGRGKDPIGRMAAAIEMPIIDDRLKGVSIEGTSYDVRELHRRFPIQVTNGRPTEDMIPSYTNSSGKRAYMNGSYGNGFYWKDRNTLMTTRHVARGQSELEANTAVDVGLVVLPDHLAAVSEEQIIKDDGTLTNADIHGALVAVVGIDPDDTSDARGHKTFIGIAARTTAALYMRATPSLSNEWRAHLDNSFTILLPPGETMESGRGLSGAHVFVWKGEWKFGGIFWSVSSSIAIPEQHRTVTLGQFHGIDDIRRELKERGAGAAK